MKTNEFITESGDIASISNNKLYVTIDGGMKFTEFPMEEIGSLFKEWELNKLVDGKIMVKANFSTRYSDYNYHNIGTQETIYTEFKTMMARLLNGGGLHFGGIEGEHSDVSAYSNHIDIELIEDPEKVKEFMKKNGNSMYSCNMYMESALEDVSYEIDEDPDHKEIFNKSIEELTELWNNTKGK